MNNIENQLEVKEEVKEVKSYKQLFAVYGTLRFGQGNWRWCLDGVSDYLGTIKTKPEYTLYTLGGFPGVAEGGDTEITIDVFGTNSQSCIANVNGLEGHIGRNRTGNWYDTCDVETPWGTADMFIMNDLRNRKSEDSIIKTGDWLNRTKKEDVKLEEFSF